MSGHSTIFQKIAYSANFGHNGGKTTMFEKGRVSFSESHRLGLCGSEVKTCLHWSAYRTNWAPTVYILLFSCSVSRAVYLQLVPNFTSEFIRCLKRLMVRRERPKIVYSENVKTFKAEAKLLQKINKDEKSRSKSRTNNLEIHYTKSPMVGWSIWTFNWPNETQFTQIY